MNSLNFLPICPAIIIVSCDSSRDCDDGGGGNAFVSKHEGKVPISLKASRTISNEGGVGPHENKQIAIKLFDLMPKDNLE